MKYQKPEIIAASHATALVQATGKNGKAADSPQLSATAYEADE